MRAFGVTVIPPADYRKGLKLPEHTAIDNSLTTNKVADLAVTHAKMASQGPHGRKSLS